MNRCDFMWRALVHVWKLNVVEENIALTFKMVSVGNN